MRPQAWLLVGAALALGGGLMGLLLGTERKEAANSAVTASGVAAIDPQDAVVSLPGEESSDVALGDRTLTGPPALKAPDRVSNRGAGDDLGLCVVDRSGSALLGFTGTLPASQQDYVKVVQGPGAPPAPGQSLEDREATEIQLERTGRIERTAGWIRSFERPEAPAFVALLFGDFVVASVAVEPSATEVVLRVDPLEIQSMEASLRGSLGGMLEATSLLSLEPARPGRLSRTMTITGEGAQFEARGLPPGRFTLRVRGEADAFWPALRAAKDASSLGAVPLGKRVRDREQWDLRLGVLRRIQMPVADIELVLQPAEARDLGRLDAPRATAAILQLTGSQGQPMDAAGIQVRALGEAAGTRGTGDVVDLWIFESLVCCYPLPSRPVELLVTVGRVGALVRVDPVPLAHDAALSSLPVRLQPLSVVLLGSAGERLLTGRGRLIQVDRRWEGSRYRGQLIGPAALAVPAGSYVLEQTGGVRAAFTVGSGELVDARGGSPSLPVKLEQPFAEAPISGDPEGQSEGEPVR